MRVICCGFLVFFLSTAAAAQSADEYRPDIETDTPLSNSELISVFTDQTHRGTYNFARRNIQTFAFEETTSSDGRTHHAQGSRIDTGDWFISGNRICFTYDTLDFSGSCFHIYQVGNCYYHYSLTPRGESLGRFTARSVIKGERPSCEPGMS